VLIHILTVNTPQGRNSKARPWRGTISLVGDIGQGLPSNLAELP
jgi:hypothetical protein